MSVQIQDMAVHKTVRILSGPTIVTVALDMN